MLHAGHFAIYPCTVGSSSWESGSLQSLLHSDAMVIQAQGGKTGAVCGSGDRNVSTGLGSHSEALPVEGLEDL